MADPAPEAPPSSDRTVPRRGVLRSGAGIAVALTAATAGCLGDDDRPGSTPTGAVEAYFEALAEGDRDAANEYAHEDGDYYVDEAAGVLYDVLGDESLAIDETDVVDVETAVESMHADPDDDRIEEMVDAELDGIETLTNEYGFEDHVHVRHDAEADGLSFNPVVLCFEADDRWLLWSDATIVAVEYG